MYRKAGFCVLLRHEVDACHRGVAHAERTHHVLVVWLAADSWPVHHWDHAWDWLAVVGKRHVAVGAGDSVIDWHLPVTGAIGVVGGE